MNIEKYRDLISEIKVNQDKSTTWSIRGVSRLCNLSPSTIVETFSSDRIGSSKLAQTLIEQGFEPVRFSSEGIPDEAVAFIVEYYAFDAGKRCKEKAKDVYRILGKVGIRVFSLTVTGHNLEIKEKEISHRYEVGSVQDHIEGLKLLFNEMNISPQYLPGILAEGVKEAHPQLAGTAEQMKVLMASNSENNIHNQSFTVTEIGQKLAIKFSAVKLNKILSSMGYQVKENKRWVLTKLGKENGGVVIATTQKGRSNNVEQIRWKEEIIDKINEYLEE